MAHIFYVQWVPRDSLHGLQQEAGQWHAFTPVVCSNFLMVEKTAQQQCINNIYLAKIQIHFYLNLKINHIRRTAYVI